MDERIGRASARTSGPLEVGLGPGRQAVEDGKRSPHPTLLEDRLAKPLGRILVIDLETAPDPAAVALAGRGGQIARAALHRIDGLSILTATEGEDGHWSGLSLTSACDSEERLMLAKVDAALAGLGDRHRLIVSYNGLRHDSAILRRRLAANWAFELRHLAAMHRFEHVDLMRVGTFGWRNTWPTLRDACAGLGIPNDALDVHHATRIAPKAVRKSQADVVSTFLLLLHEVALARASARPLVTAWRTLSDHLGLPGVRAPHLEQFRQPALAGGEA